MGRTPEDESRWSMAVDARLAIACALFGAFLSALPHLLWWPTVGKPYWISDFDEIGFYAQVAAKSYHDPALKLTDPSSLAGQSTYYPRLQFLPSVLVARALSLGPLGFGLIWRIVAGFSLGASAFLALRWFTGSRWLAAALAVFLLSDSGLSLGAPVLRQIALLEDVLTARTNSVLSGEIYGVDRNWPNLLVHFRMLSPGGGLAFVWLHILLLARARAQPSTTRVVAAGLSFGILFYLYFYYWTAVGLALLLGCLFDAGHRRVYFHTGWIGLIVGLPTVVAGYRLKQAASPDWGPRNDLFIPIGRLRELIIPKKMILLIGLGLAWTVARRRDLLYPGLILVSAPLLSNHQLVTGLQIENFHWFYFLLCPCFGLFATIIVADMACSIPTGRFSRPIRVAMLVLLAAHVAAGIVLRAFEATRYAMPIHYMEAYQKYVDQRMGPTGRPLARGQVVGGDRLFVDLAVILDDQVPLSSQSVVMSPEVDNETMDARDALNGVLSGLDRATFRDQQVRPDGVANFGIGKGPWMRDPEALRERIASRMNLFDASSADPQPALDRFRVRYVALRSGRPVPSPLQTESWRKIEEGPTWDLWERRKGRRGRSSSCVNREIGVCPFSPAE